MPQNVGSLEDLIRKNIHIDQLFSFQYVYTGRFLICALKFVGTSFTDKRKVHRSANVRKTS